MTKYNWDNAPTICELDGYRWVLGPEAEDREMNWKDATEWCESVGGVLPTRDMLLIAYMNKDIRDSFMLDEYWSSSSYVSTCAWFQGFVLGYQDYDVNDNTYLVRAVKAIKIGEE